MRRIKKITVEKRMKNRRQNKYVVEVVLILGTFFVLANLGLVGRSLYNAVTQERSTYSVVAVDPETRDVGIAGASCVPISAGAMTTLVPGKGAAATQAALTLQKIEATKPCMQRTGLCPGIEGMKGVPKHETVLKPSPDPGNVV